MIAFARDAGKPVRVADAAILPVATAAFPTPAQRPANSRLDTQKFRAAFGLALPDWQAGVERMLGEVLT